MGCQCCMFGFTRQSKEQRDIQSVMQRRQSNDTIALCNGKPSQMMRKQSQIDLKQAVQTLEQMKNQDNPQQSKHTLKQARSSIEAEQVDLDVDQYLRNTRSSIVKISKNSRKKAQEKKQQSLPKQQVKKEVQQLRQSDIHIQSIGQSAHQIMGSLGSSNLGSSLRLTIDHLQFEFILPKCSAGPLIVPYIQYDHYQSA